MTTDTVAKARSRRFDLGGVTCTASGICKGAGMIKPDMATMLAYVATDAAVAAPLLRELTRWIADRSFNRVTIDGDTSTNDSFIVIASGAAGATVIESDADPRFPVLREELLTLAGELAQSIARDGEGATRFVTVEVIGARDDDEAKRVAFTIAESPLIKTAMFAGDPNWGRFCMAIGRAGVADLDTRGVSLFLDDVCVARGGMISTDYSEEAGATVMARPEYRVLVDLSRGHGRDRVWTCDFSYDYVKINAEYRT
jgi:glutamate N-acetyltransferase/amino-acid N-acetyltransferase